MEKIDELIQKGQLFEFKDNSYTTSHGTYSRASDELLAWVVIVEDFIRTNYGEESAAFKFYQSFDQRKLTGNDQYDFDKNLTIVMGALKSCKTIAPKKKKPDDHLVIRLIKHPLFWPVALVVAGSSFGLGFHFGTARFDKDKSDYYEQSKFLKAQNESLILKLDSIQKSKNNVTQTTYDIFINGGLTPGLDMGTDGSDNKTQWVKTTDGMMCMSVHKDMTWGTVYITVGKPSKDPPPPRAAKDFSKYTKLVLELKGDSGAIVSIGLKDNVDLDKGNNSKYPISLKKGWNSYEINLRENFESADLQKLYVVTEFDFDNHPQTLYVRKIQFMQ